MACNSNFKVDTTRCSVDCASQPCEVEAYGDIGGTGVILGFVITAWLVVILLVVYYISVYDYSLDIFRPIDDFETVSDNPNPVDRVFLSTVRKLRFLDFSHTTEATREKINKDFNKSILAFADIQIFTGIGIIASGIRPAVCGLQAYHWELIVNLAWFSSITHLSALSFLRHYLVNRRWQLWIRGLMMGVLAGLLAGAVALAGHFDWDEYPSKTEVAPSYSVRCVFIKEMNTHSLAFESMVFDLLLIAYGYTIRLMKTWKRTANWPIRASNTLSDWSSSRLQSWRPRNERRSAKYFLWTGVLQPLAIALPRVIYLQLNMFTSYLAEVFWLVFTAIWRTVRLELLVRNYRPKAENDWAFGQVLPLIMIAAPLVLLSTAIASLYRARRRWREQGQQSYLLESIRATSLSSRSHHDSQASDNREHFESHVDTSPSPTRTSMNIREEQDTTNTADEDAQVGGEHGESLVGVNITADQGSGASSISGSGPREQSLRPHPDPPHQSHDNAAQHDELHNENILFLESSTAFRGAVLLAACSYVCLAILIILSGRNIGISGPMASFSMPFLVGSPLLQMFWLIYTSWAFGILTGASFLHLTVFFIILLATLVLQFVFISIAYVGLIIASAIVVYGVLATWAAFLASGGSSPRRQLISGAICVKPR